MGFSADVRASSGGILAFAGMVGFVLILVGLYGVYFGVVSTEVGTVRIVGSVAVIGVGGLLIYGALIDHPYLQAFAPRERPEDQGRGRKTSWDAQRSSRDDDER